MDPIVVPIETDTCCAPHNVCLLIWIVKLETSHVLQGNKNKTFRGRCDRFPVYIEKVRLSIKEHSLHSYDIAKRGNPIEIDA